MKTPSTKSGDKSVVDSMEQVRAALHGFDYELDEDDFVLYQVAGLIEDDRASFDDEEFRRTIDAGVSDHVESRPAIRKGLAQALRASVPSMDAGTQAVAARVIGEIESPAGNLRNVMAVVLSYTEYLFAMLERAADSSSNEEQGNHYIDRYRSKDISVDAMTTGLRSIGRAAVGPAADLLFESGEDVEAARAAIDILVATRSPAAARVLAHAVSEPLFDEQTETLAFEGLRSLWPLPRHYMLTDLQKHEHEDIPFRWFELLVACEPESASDLALEEFIVHGSAAEYREDLTALLIVLLRCSDPQLEDKILGLLNSQDTPREIQTMLEAFLKERGN